MADSATSVTIEDAGVSATAFKLMQYVQDATVDTHDYAQDRDAILNLYTQCHRVARGLSARA